jgi:ABC-2 type transport system ATP-binding protein
MSLTADHLVVIAAGRLVAESSVAELSAGSTSLEDAVLRLIA